jgi:hypothetical protein
MQLKRAGKELEDQRDRVSYLDMFNPRAKKHASELPDILPLCSIL